MKAITHRDQIHGDVRFDSLAIALLNTPALQRLGRIYQLGYAHLVYRGGTHTRLSHVMGASHVAGQLVEFLRQNYIEGSPYTRCVFDAEIGIIGIANKASLVPSVKYLAFRTQDLLAHTEVALGTNTYVNIAPIPDPNDFVSTLETAYRVSRFTATFHGPNPFDADELFQKPLSVYLYSANGSKGKAQIQGEDLNRGVIQSVARSTAATGNEASATIKRERGQRSTVVHLRGDAAKRRYDQDEKLEAVLKDLQGLYKRVRLNEDN